MTNTNPRRICLIDDDPVYTFVVRKMLKYIRQSDCLVNFPNGEVALNWLKSHINESSVLPELIFLDISMPVMNGFEFLEAWQEARLENSLSIPIYMITSSTSTEDKERASNFPDVAGYIVKPVTKDQLRLIFE